MAEKGKMPDMREGYKTRYAQFNAKIDALRDHPKYEWLREYANEARVRNEGGYGILAIYAADFIDRIETMDIAFIREWLDGKNELNRDEYNAWLLSQRGAQAQMSTYIEKESLVKDLTELARYQEPYKQSTILGVVSTIENRKPADVASESEMARRIFAEIDDALDGCARDNGEMILWVLTELKKKYVKE